MNLFALNKRQYTSANPGKQEKKVENISET
jgi:hypothetical protein